MSIVAGSYERFLFGYACPTSDSEDPKLTRTFTLAAHKGIVKSLAAAGPFVASGGADDMIHLFDLKGNKDLGFLVNPGEGPVTALAFCSGPGMYSPSHLVSGSADGTLTLWTVSGGWECMKSMKGHRREITAIAVHPSGKIALTTSRDGSLRLWDLVKGRAAFTTKLGENQIVEALQFDPAGERYAMLSGNSVTLHGVGGGEAVLSKMQHPRRVLCMSFGLLPGVLVTGCEDGCLRAWHADSGHELICIQNAHAVRIKALAVVPDAGDKMVVASASSDGLIKVWDVVEQVEKKLKENGKKKKTEVTALQMDPVCSVETRARLTTLCATDRNDVMVEKLALEKAKLADLQAAPKQPPQHNKKKQQPAAKTQKPAVKKQTSEPQEKQQEKGGSASKQGVVSFLNEADIQKSKVAERHQKKRQQERERQQNKRKNKKQKQ